MLHLWRCRVPYSGSRLQEIREDRGYSREYLADRSGRSYGSIYQYEVGRMVPPLPVAERLAATLGVSVTDLIEAA